MTGQDFSLVEMKSQALIVTPKTKIDDRFESAVSTLQESIRAIASDIPLTFYVAKKFKKFGDKEQAAILLNPLPGFAASGLDPAVAHVVLNGERAGLRADAPRLADAATLIISRFIDFIDGPGAHFDERFSWVAMASLIAVSHPMLKDLVTVHPVTRKSIAFADRYVSMALKDMVNFKEMASGSWNRSALLQIVLSARQRHETRRLTLPTSLDIIRAEAFQSLKEAQVLPTAA